MTHEENAALSPAAARARFREGLVVPTSGFSAGFAQANLLAVPEEYAFEFLLFAQRNPKPCPVLGVLEAGLEYGALGGIVFILPSAVIPGSYSTSLTFFLWTILLLGGAATVLGPTLGAVLFWIVFAFLGALLPAMANAGYLPMSGAQADVVRYILIGIVLMLIVIALTVIQFRWVEKKVAY